MVGILGTLIHIPMDSLERGAAFPQPPEISARLTAVAVNLLSLTPLIQPDGKLFTSRVILERVGILLYLIPCNKKRSELAFPFAAATYSLWKKFPVPFAVDS